MSLPTLLTLLSLLQSNLLLLLLSSFLILPIVFPQIFAQCGESIITDQDYLTCSTNHQLDSSMTSFPSFLRTNKVTKLTFDVIFNPVSACSPMSSTKDLFIITIQDSLGQENKIFEFYLVSGGSHIVSSVIGTNNLDYGYGSINFAVNKWLELVGSIDLDNKLLNIGVNIPGIYYTANTDFTASFYSSAVGFDVNTKFYFCSSLPSFHSGANYQCSVKSLNVWYTFVSGGNIRGYYGALSPVLAAYYRMDENYGSTIKDATGTLTTGSFGTPTINQPTWSSTVGVEFTSTSQYIELPAFSTTSTSANPFTSQSFTISFWFKFNSATTSANIFRYTNSLLSQDNFGLYIDGSGYLTIAMGNKQYLVASTTPISSSVWTLITASYSIASSNSYNTLFLYKDQTRICYQDYYSVSSTNFASSSPFRVIVGGSNSFLGTIVHLHIFSPAANHLNDLTGCSSAKCAINLGTSDPFTCVSYPCGSSNCDQCSGTSINSCLSCASGYEFEEDSSVCALIETHPTTSESSVNSAIKPSQTITSTLTKVYNALTKGSSAGFSAAVAGKIFSNIKYLDIGYSLELQEALKYWKSSFVSIGLDLDPPQGLEDNIPELGVPPAFEKYDVSSDFLINFWEGIVVLVFMVALFGIVRAIEYFTNASKCKRFPYTTIRTARFMTQNLLYSQFYGIFADVIMFSVLNYRTQDPSKGLASLSLFLSAALLVVTIIVLTSQFYLLIRYQHLKKNQDAMEKFLQESQGGFISFEDFQDTSLFRQSFLFLLVLRDLLFSLILTTLFEHPLAQTILILILNLTIITLLFWKQPFKKRFGLLQQLFYEFVTLAVNICVIILAAKDQARSTAYDPRQSIGKFIIITNLVFNFTVIILLVYGLAMTAKEAYQDHKANKAKRIPSISANTSSSQIVNTSHTQTRSFLGMNSTHNQTESKKNAWGFEQSFNGIDNSEIIGYPNDLSGNQLLVSHPDPQNQDLSLFEIPQIRNQYDLNHSHLTGEQQSLRLNSNNFGRNNIFQSQLNQKQNFTFASKDFGQENEAQNQQKLAIQSRNNSDFGLGQSAQRRKMRVRKNISKKELEISYNIQGRPHFKQED